MQGVFVLYRWMRTLLVQSLAHMDITSSSRRSQCRSNAITALHSWLALNVRARFVKVCTCYCLFCLSLCLSLVICSLNGFLTETCCWSLNKHFNLWLFFAHLYNASFPISRLAVESFFCFLAFPNVLHSNILPCCSLFRTVRSTIGDCTFPATAASVWNSLPESVRSSPSLQVFRSRLKTDFFARSYRHD